jgi:hypothetical protein
MKLLAAIAMVVVLGFAGVMAVMWVREGSLEEAGAHMDEGLSEMADRAEPVGEELKDLGEATVQTVDRAAANIGEGARDATNEAADDVEKATDGNDRT